MALDSIASFKARLVELNLPQGYIDSFEARRVATFANFAFISPYQPNSLDEAPFVLALKDILGVEPGDFLPTYRRLFYESHTMAVQDPRQKLDAREGQELRKLAMPERMERLNRLKASLTGLTLDAQLEPSHSLVDRIVAMAEEQSIYYVDLSLCTSRESEVNMLKKEPALEFTADGAIRLAKKHPEASADTTGELRVRLCMQRRALAFQIANIATFVTSDAFIPKLFALLTKKPILGYRTVSLAQIIAADQALWQKVSQETRGKILTSGDPKLVDKAVLDFMDATEVTYHLLPVRDQPKSDPPLKDPKPPKKPPKTGNPRDRRPAGEDRPKIDIPDGCSSKNDSSQNICFAFNRKACPVRGYYMFAGGRIALENMLSRIVRRESQKSDKWKARASHLVIVRVVLHAVSHLQVVCESPNYVFRTSWRLTYGTFIFAGIRRFRNCSQLNSMFHQMN